MLEILIGQYKNVEMSLLLRFFWIKWAIFHF